MYGYYGFYWDPTYYLVVIGAIICLIASARVKEPSTDTTACAVPPV